MSHLSQRIKVQWGKSVGKQTRGGEVKWFSHLLENNFSLSKQKYKMKPTDTAISLLRIYEMQGAHGPVTQATADTTVQLELARSYTGYNLQTDS